MDSPATWVGGGLFADLHLPVLRIRDPVPFWPLDPGWVKKIMIRDEQPGLYFRELINNFWVKILKFYADPG